MKVKRKPEAEACGKMLHALSNDSKPERGAGVKMKPIFNLNHRLCEPRRSSCLGIDLISDHTVPGHLTLQIWTSNHSGKEGAGSCKKSMVPSDITAAAIRSASAGSAVP